MRAREHVKSSPRWRRLEDRIIRLKHEYLGGQRTIEQYWAAIKHVINHN